MRKLRPPRAYCTCCRATYRSGTGFSHRAMGKVPNCPGIIRIAPDPRHWRVCAWCSASGSLAARACRYCGGDGWLLAGSLEAMRGVAMYLRP
jgi:hypothetical protein